MDPDPNASLRGRRHDPQPYSAGSSNPYAAQPSPYGAGGNGAALPAAQMNTTPLLGASDSKYEPKDIQYNMGVGSGSVDAELGGMSAGGGNASMASGGFGTLEDRKTLRKFLTVLGGVCAVTGVLSLIFMGMSSGYMLGVLAIVGASFWYVWWLTNWIFDQSQGNLASMFKVWNAIKQGAEGYLRTQYGAIRFIAYILAGVLFVIYLFRETGDMHASATSLAIMTAVSFLLGAFCSALAGYLGMWAAVRVNVRVALAASARDTPRSLLLAFRGGAVTAVLSASLCILGLAVLYLLAYIFFVTIGGLSAGEVPLTLVGYGFGASFVALFMQLGGGIYTKAADIGADMCGKIEAGIPEDDPRNPAVIADLVGDNVGDCAGSMADVFESIAAEIVGTMILASTLAKKAGMDEDTTTRFIFFPLVVHAFDLVVSGVGIWWMYPKDDKENPMTTLKRSYIVAMVLALVGFVGAARLMLYVESAPSAWLYFVGCGLVGIIMSYLLILTTQYYTDYDYSPVKSIVTASATGHGTNVIAGVSVGMESCGFPILMIAVSLLSSYYLGSNSGLPEVAAGVFGTAVATMGMLCTAVYILSMNNFGPIADNAGGIVEMSGEGEAVRAITDKLDAVGNVTKAATKGYAVGGSAMACFVLFQAFLDEMGEVAHVDITSINLTQLEVVVGGLLGIMMVFVFTGWVLAAVGRTATKVVWEVRRQFKEDAGIMQGTSSPDYRQCVSIVTASAIREMGKPALLALGMPIMVGFTFRFLGGGTMGIEVLASFLIFGTLTGLMMAIFLDNSGGAWDNAKKLVEKNGEKNTEKHKAAVTGDTVGDPFKDTAGPSLHVIITTMSTTALVLGPLFIASSSD